MSVDDALSALQRNRDTFRRELARIDRDSDLTPAERTAARSKAHAFAMRQHGEAVASYKRAARANATQDDADDGPPDINAAIRAMAAGSASADAQARLNEAILLEPPRLP